MPHYKDPAGKLHFLDDAAFEHLLPPGSVKITDKEARALQTPTAAEILARYTAAIQERLDAFARTRGYDGILSATTYAASTVRKFMAEGQYALDARDATWAKAAEILASVEAGGATPTLDEVLAALPSLAWPEV